MSFSISGMDGIGDAINKQMMDALHEKAAQALVERMRASETTDVDKVKLDLTSDTDDPTMQLDAERVKRRAQQILAEE